MHSAARVHYVRTHSLHNDMKISMQAEAAALKVPIRFLHQLRMLLPQNTEAARTDSEEDVWSDPETESDDAALASTKVSPDISEISSEEEDSNLGSSALQAALMAAPQQLAAGSGILTQPAYVIIQISYKFLLFGYSITSCRFSA